MKAVERRGEVLAERAVRAKLDRIEGALRQAQDERVGGESFAVIRGADHVRVSGRRLGWALAQDAALRFVLGDHR